MQKAIIIFISIQCVAMVFASPLTETKKEIQVDGQPVWKIARELSRQYQVRVCVEENQPKSKVTFYIQNSTLKDAVNKACALSTNYLWSYDHTNEIVNIYRKNAGMLNWDLEEVSIQNRTIQDVLEKEDALRLKKHGITFFPGRGNLSWMQTRITLEEENITAREVLNIICTKLPFKARWELLKLKENGPVILMFRGC